MLAFQRKFHSAKFPGVHLVRSRKKRKAYQVPINLVINDLHLSGYMYVFDKDTIQYRNSTLVRVMVWCLSSDQLMFEAMMILCLYHELLVEACDLCNHISQDCLIDIVQLPHAKKWSLDILLKSVSTKPKHSTTKRKACAFSFHFNTLFGHLVPLKRQRQVPNILEIIHTHAYTHTNTQTHTHTLPFTPK